MLHPLRPALGETGRLRLCVVVGAAAVLCVGVSTAGAAKPKPKPPKPTLAITPGTYSGTVSMSPVYPEPTSSSSITLSGTWSLKVDSHDHLTGSESLAGTAPISASSGCTASPLSYTLGFAAVFGKTGFGVTGGPGVVQGNAVTINLDSQATGLGWSATPSTYQYTCGSYTSAKTILFFGEVG